MNTRFRAVSIATLTSALFLLTVSGALFGGQGESLRTKFTLAIGISLILGVGTQWVLFFKRKADSWLAIGFFPALAVLPYILFADTITESLLSGVEQLTAAFFTTAVFWVYCYLIILTANILNGAVLYGIPLGQAGKAAQFIFSLIAAYFLIAYLFGSAFPIEVRVAVVGVYVFFISYAAIWNLRLPFRDVVVSALAIALAMVLLVVVLSIWPIASIYATVVGVVVLYILLNVALEMRENVDRNMWIEYAFLLLLCVVILAVLGEWGINGSLV